MSEFKCKSCTETFPSNSRLNNHIVKSHQTKTKLRFGYGINHWQDNSSKVEYEVPGNGHISCPRCLETKSSLRTLQSHAAKACKGPIQIPSTASLEFATIQSFPGFKPIPATNGLYFIHETIGLVACRECGCGVVPEYIVSHAAQHHKITIEPQSISDIMGIVPASPGDSRLIEYTSQENPLQLEILYYSLALSATFSYHYSQPNWPFFLCNCGTMEALLQPRQISMIDCISDRP